MQNLAHLFPAVDRFSRPRTRLLDVFIAKHKKVDDREISTLAYVTHSYVSAQNGVVQVRRTRLQVCSIYVEMLNLSTCSFPNQLLPFDTPITPNQFLWRDLVPSPNSGSSSASPDIIETWESIPVIHEGGQNNFLVRSPISKPGTEAVVWLKWPHDPDKP
jgi:hypothetical protein